MDFHNVLTHHVSICLFTVQFYLPCNIYISSISKISHEIKKRIYGIILKENANFDASNSNETKHNKRKKKHNKDVAF